MWNISIFVYSDWISSLAVLSYNLTDVVTVDACHISVTYILFAI